MRKAVSARKFKVDPIQSAERMVSQGDFDLSFRLIPYRAVSRLTKRKLLRAKKKQGWDGRLRQNILVRPVTCSANGAVLP